MYCDVNLRKAGFNGEAMRSGTVLVVKTHKSVVTWTDLNKPDYSNKVCNYCDDLIAKKHSWWHVNIVTVF